MSELSAVISLHKYLLCGEELGETELFGCRYQSSALPYITMLCYVIPGRAKLLANIYVKQTYSIQMMTN